MYGIPPLLFLGKPLSKWDACLHGEPPQLCFLLVYKPMPYSYIPIINPTVHRSMCVNFAITNQFNKWQVHLNPSKSKSTWIHLNPMKSSCSLVKLYPFFRPGFALTAAPKSGAAMAMGPRNTAAVCGRRRPPRRNWQLRSLWSSVSLF